MEIEIIDVVPTKSKNLPPMRVSVNDIMAGEEILSYKDIDGIDKTIPVKDIPLLISKWADDNYVVPVVQPEE